MMKETRNYLAFVSILFILAVGFPLMFLPTQAAPSPPPLIRLQYATFDPLIGEPRISTGQRLTIRAKRPATCLLQFTGPVHDDWKAQVEAAGVHLYSYVPDFAFIARMDTSAAEKVEALPFVRWAGLYHPAYRLATTLQTSEVSQTSEVWTVTVQTLPNADLDALTRQVKAWGGEVQDQPANDFAGYLRVSLPANRLSDLVALDEVLWVEPYFEPQLYNDVGGGTIMRANGVRTSLGLYGSGQIVAVADTGLDVGTTGSAMSDDFEGRIVEGQAICAYYQGGRTTWNDFGAHGTHVSGSVLGSGQNSGSNPAAHQYGGSFAGVAPEAQLVFQSIDNDPSVGLECIPDDRSTYIFGPAYDLGARVHTNSWGGQTGGTAENPTYGGYNTYAQATDQAAWTYKNLLILYSAGNSGTDANADGVVDHDSIGSPGTAKNVLTVGASESNRSSGGYSAYTWGQGWPADFPANPIVSDKMSDDPDGMAAFSSRGPTDDGRVKPDIAAPGTNIISARSHDPDAGTGWGVYNADYIYEGGTSMSTPLTAGAAALVREWLTRIKSVANPSAALMKAVLINGAADTSPGQYGTGSTQEIPAARPNNVTGWGRVDLVESLNPSAPRAVWFKDNTTGLSTGGSVEYTLSIGSSQTQGNRETRGQGDREIGSWSISAPPRLSAAYPLVAGEHPVIPRIYPGVWRGDSSFPNYPLGTVELLQNRSFEDATGNALDHWQDNDPYEYYIGQTNTDAHSGTYSAFMGGYQGDPGLMLYQGVNFPADATAATLQVYLEGLGLDSDTIQAEVWIENGANDILVDTHALSAVNSTWTENTWNLSSSAVNQLKGTQVWVVFHAMMATTEPFYLVDDASLVVTTGGGPTETPTPTPTPTNTPTPTPTGTPSPCPEAISDGGFEASTGDTTNPHWTVSGNAQFRDNVGSHGGNWVALLGWTGGPTDGDVWQSVAVSSDATTGTLSLYYKDLDDGIIDLDIEVLNAAGSQTLLNLGTLTSASSSWQQFQRDLSAAEMATLKGQTVRLRPRLNDADYDDLLIDDVSWTICTGGAPPQTGGPFRLTLAWTDYPGTPGAAKALVNDLDLEVIAPNSTHYYGNQGLYTSGQCLRSGQWDACNNVEGVIIPDAPYGTYTVIVHGYNVAQGPQPFALVVSGDNLREGSGPPPTNDHFIYLPLVLKQ